MAVARAERLAVDAPTLQMAYERLSLLGSASKKAKSVEDIVKSASMSASHGFWQIIELQESDSPGEFVVWAMTTKQQHSLTTPRSPWSSRAAPPGGAELPVPVGQALELMNRLYIVQALIRR